MKRFIALFFIFVITITANMAQKPGNSLLWKVSGNGLEKSSYLYGTFHLLCPDQLNISDKVSHALDESGQVVMELDFDDPSVMQTLQQKMMYRNGTTAKDYLDEKEYKIVSDFFRDSMKMPFERLQAIKPFFLSSMSMIHFLGCQPAGFEKVLTSKAKKKNMEVKGLETPEEQLSFIENIPMEKQKTMLVENIKNYKESKKMFDKMVNHYLNEELEGINEIIDQYMSKDYAQMQQNLLIQRNKNWIPEIKEMMQAKASLIAVGAGHLPGKEGLIDLLRKAGYTVVAVK
jgi:uncharacterized protein YbaP (TraB family)